MKVIQNPDKEIVDEIRKKLKENDGYCPCVLTRRPEDKCMCENFKDQLRKNELGECHCGLYVIVEND